MAELMKSGVPGKSACLDNDSGSSEARGTPCSAIADASDPKGYHGELFVTVLLAEATVDSNECGEAAGKLLLSMGKLIRSPATSTTGVAKADVGAPSFRAVQT